MKKALCIVFCTLSLAGWAEHAASPAAASRDASPFWSKEQLDSARVEFAQTIADSKPYKAANAGAKALLPALAVPVPPEKVGLPKERLEAFFKALSAIYNRQEGIARSDAARDAALAKKLALSKAKRAGQLPALALGDWLALLSSFTFDTEDRAMAKAVRKAGNNLLPVIDELLRKAGFTILDFKSLVETPATLAFGQHYLLRDSKGNRLAVTFNQYGDVIVQANADAKTFQDSDYVDQEAGTPFNFAVPSSDKTITANVAVELNLKDASKTLHVNTKRGTYGGTSFLDSTLYRVHKNRVPYSEDLKARVLAEESIPDDPTKPFGGKLGFADAEREGIFLRHTKLENNALNEILD